MLRMLAGEAARRFGERVAFDAQGSGLSFAELDRLSDRVASGYAHRGVRIGDVVAVGLPNGADFPICYLAAAKIGAISAGLDLGHPAAVLRRLVDLLEPTLIVTVAGGLPVGPGQDVALIQTRGFDAATREPYYNPLRLGNLVRQEAPPPPLPPDPQRSVAVVFTSRNPRGVVFANRQLEAIRTVGAGMRWGGGETRLVSTSLTHVGFMTRLPVLLQTGRTSCLLEHWSAEAAIRVIVDQGLGVVQGSPAQLEAVMSQTFEAPSVELILAGGAPVPAALIRALRARFAVPVCNRYLCTEAGLGLGTRPDDPPEYAEETVGRPRVGVDLAIRSPDGRTLSTGQTGEVLLRSGAVMSGYWKDPQGSAEMFAKDGFVRTGDYGFMDDLGRLHLVDPRG